MSLSEPDRIKFLQNLVAPQEPDDRVQVYAAVDPTIADLAEADPRIGGDDLAHAPPGGDEIKS